MKKILSIFSLLLYINVALGTGVYCQFCNGKLINAGIVGFGSGNCNCKCSTDQQDMGCCKSETSFCKSDTHKVQSVSYSPSVSINEYLIHPAIENTVSIEHANKIPINQFSYHYLIKTASSRRLLSFIHNLRI